MSLRHPNLIVGLDRGESDGVPYIATELVVGYTLRTVLSALAERKQYLPLEHFVTVASAVLKGLDHAHRATDAAGRSLGIVHRNLSPDSILVTREGEVRIKDFALARARAGEFNTALGMLVGTVGYLSPEQGRGYPLDGRSDLYTLGVTFYEMLAGQPVVAEKDFAAALRCVLEKDPPSLRRERADVPASIDVVIRVATAKSARDRYKDAEDMRTALVSAARLKTEPRAHDFGHFIQSLLPKQGARVGGLLEGTSGFSWDLPETAPETRPPSDERPPLRSPGAPDPAPRRTGSVATINAMKAVARTVGSALRRKRPPWRSGVFTVLALAVVAAAFAAGRLSASWVEPDGGEAGPRSTLGANPDRHAAPSPPAGPPEPVEARPPPANASSPQPATSPVAKAHALHAPVPDEPVEGNPITALQPERPEARPKPHMARRTAIRNEDEYIEAFMRLHAVLFERARRLPADKRASVLRDLDVADRELDIERLARALSRFPRTPFGPPPNRPEESSTTP